MARNLQEWGMAIRPRATWPSLHGPTARMPIFSSLIDVRDDTVIEAVDAWRIAGIITLNRRNQILAPL